MTLPFVLSRHFDNNITEKMSILAWIEDQKRLKVLNAPKHVNLGSDSSKGLWTRCDKCGVILYIKHLKENQRVCFGCSYHLQMTSQERIESLLDKDSWRPLDETVSPCDPLEFHDQKSYTDRLQDAQDKTGLQDAIQTGTGMVDGIPVALGVMDFDFMGGSMGSVVGEKLTRLIEYATQEGLTLLVVCASGGARMQEGVFSLMQMAKVSSALQIYQSCANLLYISILTSPTTGGVTASFAMLGDIVFAEPKALIAFAGRRVIEQTLREDLPDDFQTSEYMLHHGLVDLIVPRRFLRQALSETIRLYQNAPFKRLGRIPFGVQNPISFLTEERVRRKWVALPSANTERDKAFLHEYSARDSNQDARLLEHRDSYKENPLQLSKKQLFDQMRQSIEYREILTSFEMIFNLFSRESYTSFKDVSSLGDADSKNDAGRATVTEQGSAHVNQSRESLSAKLGSKPKRVVDQGKGFVLTDTQHKESKKKYALQSSGVKRASSKHQHVASFSAVDSNKALTRIPLMGSNRSLSHLYPNTILFVLFPPHKKAVYTSPVKDQTSVVKRFVPQRVFRQNTVFYVDVMHMMTKLLAKLKTGKLPQAILLERFRSLSEEFALNSYEQLYKQLQPFSKGKPNATSNGEKGFLQPKLGEIASSLCSKKTKADTKIWATNGALCSFAPKGYKTRFCTTSQDAGSTSTKGISTTLCASTDVPFLRTSSNKLLSRSKKSRESNVENKQGNRSRVGTSSTSLSKALSPTPSNLDSFKDKALVESNGAIENRANKDQRNTNFLNQAIELAAAESVEWRAFYLDQQMSRTTGFLEDFVQPAFDTHHKQQENLLFYRSICRNSFS